MEDSQLWTIPSVIALTLLLGLSILAWWKGARGPLWPLPGWVLAGGIAFTVGDLGTFFAPDPLSLWTAEVILYSGLIVIGPAVFLLSARHAALHSGPVVPGWVQRVAPAWSGVWALVLLTNPIHEGFLRPDGSGGYEWGALWYPYAAGGYAWALVAIGLAVEASRRAGDRAERRESRLIAAAPAFALLGNAIAVTRFLDPPFDPTSLGLAAGAAAVIAAVRKGLPSLGAVSANTLLRSATDGVVILDAERRVVGRSPAVDAWLPDGPGPGEPVIPALARALAQRERAELALTEEGLSADLFAAEQPDDGHLFRLHGQDRWVRVRSVEFSTGGPGEGLRVLRLRDETQLQRMIAAAEDQASMLEAVNSATDEGVLVHVGDEIRFTNPQFHEIWRTPPELRDSRTPGALMRAYLPGIADKERFLSAVERVREDPQVRIRDEYRLLDGRTLERISLPLVRDGEAIGRVWRVRDVTQQRDSEQALLHAQKLESLGLLSGGIAHDFNNLLVSVLGNADLARRELPGDAPAQEYLRDVERAAEQASELTRQLLAYAGKGRVESGPVHLSEVAREVIELIRVSMPKGVRLESRLAERLPTVTGDLSQIRQVVMNLLLNAADAVGDRQGDITVVTSARDLDASDAGGFVSEDGFIPGRHVLITVSDTGPGMTDDVRPRIFDPFFTTKFAGRGLGLAAVLGIVRSHRGRIAVESEPGRGATFVVALPAAGEAVAMRQPSGAAAAPDRLEATVLVVDDEPNVAHIAARMIELAGGSAIVASSGREALERYRSEGSAIDAVLLDLTMPGLSGRETLLALREIDSRVPVLLTSGYPEEEAGGLLGSEDSLGFIQKPYRSATLIASLRAALGR